MSTHYNKFEKLIAKRKKHQCIATLLSQGALDECRLARYTNDIETEYITCIGVPLEELVDIAQKEKDNQNKRKREKEYVYNVSDSNEDATENVNNVEVLLKKLDNASWFEFDTDQFDVDESDESDESNESDESDESNESDESDGSENGSNDESGEESEDGKYFEIIF